MCPVSQNSGVKRLRQSKKQAKRKYVKTKYKKS